MKKWFAFKLLFAIAACAFTATTSAVTLSVSPTIQEVYGGQARAAIVISGLGSLSAPSLGAFDINVSYDPSLLAFNNATFGDPVAGDQLDLLGLGSVQSIDASLPGLVNLLEVSIDPASVLDALQANSFTTATLNFQVISSPGVSPLNITVNALSDSQGNSINAFVYNGAITVPEPSSISLLAISTLGLFLSKRKPSKSIGV